MCWRLHSTRFWDWDFRPGRVLPLLRFSYFITRTMSWHCSVTSEKDSWLSLTYYLCAVSTSKQTIPVYSTIGSTKVCWAYAIYKVVLWRTQHWPFGARETKCIYKTLICRVIVTRMNVSNMIPVSNRYSTVSSKRLTVQWERQKSMHR